MRSPIGTLASKSPWTMRAYRVPPVRGDGQDRAWSIRPATLTPAQVIVFRFQDIQFFTIEAILIAGLAILLQERVNIGRVPLSCLRSVQAKSFRTSSTGTVATGIMRFCPRRTGTADSSPTLNPVTAITMASSGGHAMFDHCFPRPRTGSNRSQRTVRWIDEPLDHAGMGLKATFSDEG